jgi:hypothetical protein
LNSDHFLPGSDRWEDESGDYFGENETALLGCTCGQPGCGSLTMRIDSDRSVIRWSEPVWSRQRGVLPRLGPFHFDKTEYQAAIAQALSLH